MDGDLLRCLAPDWVIRADDAMLLTCGFVIVFVFLFEKIDGHSCVSHGQCLKSQTGNPVFQLSNVASYVPCIVVSRSIG